jgi:hypothetical protein
MFGSLVPRKRISILELEGHSAINAAPVVDCEVLLNVIEPRQGTLIVETFQSLRDLLRIGIGGNTRGAWVAVAVRCHSYK